jgi:hypothetical protein
MIDEPTPFIDYWNAVDASAEVLCRRHACAKPGTGLICQEVSLFGEAPHDSEFRAGTASDRATRRDELLECRETTPNLREAWTCWCQGPSL